MAATSESSCPPPQKIVMVLNSSAPSVERTALDVTAGLVKGLKRN
ncbi:hypothetical protein ABIF97_000476 [Bradyrhizobium japonicum]|jgi:hypothetical protein